VEFDAVVGKGSLIAIPKEALRSISSGRGKTVRIRLASSHEVLDRNGVTETEIEEICRLQMESEEQVMKFLFSEGVLKRAGKRFRRGLSRKASD
jgi:hypothetical protein